MKLSEINQCRDLHFLLVATLKEALPEIHLNNRSITKEDFAAPSDLSPTTYQLPHADLNQLTPSGLQW